MAINDIFTARLRLVAMTPTLLDADGESAPALASLLGASVPAEWPDANWEPHVLSFIKRQLAERTETAGWHRYVLLRGVQQTLIGTCNAHPTGEHEAEIGYAVLQPWQGCGYATEATRALLQGVFASGARSVVAHTFPHLPSSIRVMEKCGFTFDGQGKEGTVRYRLERST